MDVTRDRARQVARSPGLIFGVLMVVAIEFALALGAAVYPGHALEIILAVAVIAATLLFPRVVLVAALLATMLPQRVGPAQFDLSVTDAVAALAAFSALRYVPWGDPRLRLVLRGLLLYLIALVVSIAAHPTQRALLEWGHRGVLFGGALLIGVGIVQSGTTRIALRAFVAVSGIAAAIAIVFTLTHRLEPAEVLAMQKNHAGVVLAVAFLVPLVAKSWLAWPNLVVRVLQVLILCGLLATQSRAALVGLIVALALRSVIRSGQGRRRQASIAVLGLCGVLIAVTFVSVNTRDLSRSVEDQKFNAINTRLDTIDTTLQKVFLPNPIGGGGLRFWGDRALNTGAPHDLVVGELGESGVVGFVGFVGLLGITAVALKRGRDDLAMLGLLAFVVRVTQTSADIFWVAGPLTVALIIAGMGLTDRPGRAVQFPDGSRSSDTIPAPTPTRRRTDSTSDLPPNGPVSVP